MLEIARFTTIDDFRLTIATVKTITQSTGFLLILVIKNN